MAEEREVQVWLLDRVGEGDPQPYTPQVTRTPEEIEMAIKSWQMVYEGVDFGGPDRFEDTDEYEETLLILLEENWDDTVRQLRQGASVLEPQAAVTGLGEAVDWL